VVYMCFDFGTISWGCALGDSVSQSTQAIGAVKAISGEPIWDDIAQLVAKWRPKAFVIGYPLKAGGERFKLTDRVDDAVLSLKQQYPSYEVILADERLTTVEAKAGLFSEQGKKGLEKGKIDAESARLILLQWFEHQMMDFDELL
jgi:putative holliday junction resolvase